MGCPRPLLVLLAVALLAPAHAQVIVRHQIQVEPAAPRAAIAHAAAASAYPTDDGIFYSVRGRLSDGFTTCCTDAGPCQIPFDGLDAITAAGTGYAGGTFADTLGVLDQLIPGTPFENAGYYPLGYPGYQNCQTSHLRGFTRFSGGAWVPLGDVEDGLTLRSTFGHESWDTWASGEAYGDAYNYFDRELYGIPFNTFSKPQSHNYPLCGHGPHKGAEVDLFFEARYKAVRFEVTVEPAQIAPGEVATVTVTPVDSAGVPVGMPIRDNVAVSAYDATGVGLTGRGAGVVPLSNPSLPPATGRYWNWPNYVSREGQVFGVIAPPDSLAPTAPETVTVRAWGYSGTRNRHVVGEAELTLCPVGGCEAGGMEVTVSPAVLQPGEEGVVSVEVTAAVADLTDDDEVDLDLGEDTAQMGGLVLDGSEAAPAPSLRARLGDIRAGLVRYRVLGWDDSGAAGDSAAAFRASAARANARTADAMSALAPAAPPDDEGFGVHRQIEGIPVVLSAALVRVPSVRGEAENVDVSPLAISITVDADQLAVNERTGVTATVRFPLWARALPWQDGWPALGDADRLWLQACARNFIGETPDAIQRADFVETDADLWTVDQSAYCLKLYEDADTGPLDFFLDPPDGAYSADFEFPMTLPRDGFPPGHEQTLLVHVGLVGVYEDGAGGTEAVFLDDRAGRQMTAGKTIDVRVPDPGVEWVEPDGGWQTQHITDAPAMPDVVLTARLSDLPRGEATLAWTYQVEFSYDRREWDGSALEARTGTCTFSETTEVTIDRPVKTVEWTVPFTDETAECRFTNATNPGGDVREEWLYGDDVMIGGAVTPSVTATADGQEYTPETPVPAHSILGLNPDPADVRAGASEHLQVTIYEESAPKWAQFGATGAPIYGRPNGFGLVQMDNPEATDRSLWDWRANREQGREYLEVTIWNLMLGYPERVRTETINRRGPFPGATDFTTDEEQWKYCFQRFNGGHYWIWQPSNPRNPSGPGRWVRNPRLAVWPGHTAPAGTERWDLLVKIQADQFPEGW